MAEHWIWFAGGTIAVLAIFGAATRRRHVRRAARSRWATWRDEPRDADDVFGGGL
jgi:hypothetical protein